MQVFTVTYDDQLTGDDNDDVDLHGRGSSGLNPLPYKYCINDNCSFSFDNYNLPDYLSNDR